MACTSSTLTVEVASSILECEAVEPALNFLLDDEDNFFVDDEDNFLID